METGELEEISVFDITPISMKIQWKQESIPSSSFFEIKYKAQSPKVEKNFKRIEVNHDNEIHLTDLIPGTKYKIIVSVQDEEGVTMILYRLEASTEESKASDLIALSEKKSICLSEKDEGENSGGFAVYQMQVLKDKCIGKGVSELAFVEDESETLKLQNKVKNILLVGATGSGKSTLIDALFNHFANVQHFDQFRFKITRDVPADRRGDQAKSQTESTTCYTLPKTTNLSTKFTFNIIDTPGFNDTNQKNIERKIVQQINALLSGPIDRLHAICIVMPLQSFRLTDAQIDLLDGIKKLFAHDVNDIIYCFATFFDGGDLHILKSLKDSRVKIKDAFAFSNAYLFKKPFEGGLSSWKSNNDSFYKFLTLVNQTEGESTVNTSKVLTATEEIELKLDAIEHQMKKAIQEVINVQREVKFLNEKREELKLGRNFEYKVQVPFDKKKRISNTEKNFNCQKCKMTCHKNCWVYFRLAYRTCKVMQDRKCTVCPGECPTSDHEKESAVFEIDYKEETRTNDDLLSKYKATEQEKYLLEEKLYIVDTLIEKIKTSVKILNENMKGRDFSTGEYLDILIKREFQRQPGFTDRTKFYDLIKKNILYKYPAREALKYLLPDTSG